MSALRYNSRETSQASSDHSGKSSSQSCIPEDKEPGARCSKGDDDYETITTDDVQVHRTFASSHTDRSSSLTEVFLSLMWHGYKLGIAYYEVECPKVNFMPDCPEKDEFSLLQQVLKQVQPSCIILSSKQDERLLKVLRKAVSENGESDDDAEKMLHFLPNGDFGLEVSKRRIMSLNLPGLPSHSTETERSLYFSSIIPADNICVVRAIGGLLKYLNQARVGVELEHCSVRVPILGFSIFTVDDQIIVDSATYSALQIFYREAHPSVYKVGTSNSCKEGLSLFGILNRCRSQIGSKKLRQWFFRPLKNLTILRHRLDAISYFTQSCNMETVNSLQGCLKEMKNVPRILGKMIQAQVMPADWMALYKTVYHAVYIRDICRAQVYQVDIFKKVGKKFTDDLHKVANLLSKTVDFDASVSQNRFVVRPGLDRALDEKKRLYHGLPDLMTKVAHEELARLGENVTACNVIYLPQICYLLAIPKAEGLATEEDFEMPGLEFMFESNGVLHYKSARMKELDAMLGDTLCEIKDMETSIMHRLQNTILESSQVLLDIMECAAELDCLMALASCAQEFGYTCPELTEENIIDVRKSRHPLQELCCSPYVPNGIQSGGGHAKVKVLTGPNACGKSVYLKQVALIVYMAHIGSFVPAEKAVIGQVDRIFSRIKSLESVSVGLSSFMLDLNQMSDALNNSTYCSLVVVDEFGKGTETIDGLSLLSASLCHWLKKGDKCPHVLVSTHFHSLAQQPVLPPSPHIEFLTMETLQEGGELVFLFQLIKGHTSSSYAAHTALQAGLPPEIVKRGQEVSKLLCQYKPVHPVDDGSSRIYLERCLKIVQRFQDLDLETDDLENFLQNFVLPVSQGQVVN